MNRAGISNSITFNLVLYALFTTYMTDNLNFPVILYHKLLLRLHRNVTAVSI